MINWTSEWDLTSIPDSLLHSEAARRRVGKRKQAGNIKLETCPVCKRQITSRQRRYACPLHISPKERRKLGLPTRTDALDRLEAAIVSTPKMGPGVWSVKATGRSSVMLEFNCHSEELAAFAKQFEEKLGRPIDDDDAIPIVWHFLGGDEILETAGLAGEYENHSLNDGEMLNFFAIIPCQD
jgi:DNA-binding Lrp family transcriptional regulator